jgi:hypothetical protein
MNKWTPKNGKSDYDIFFPNSRIYTDDYEQFCHELGVLLESWDVNIVADENEIKIIFPKISSLADGTLRELSVHSQGCQAIAGNAKSLICL